MQLTDEQFTKAMRALSEPNRIEIIRIVAKNCPTEGVVCSTVLNQMDISQSTFSHHVTELREAGILNGTIEGRSVKLTVNHPLLDEIQLKIKNLNTF